MAIATISDAGGLAASGRDGGVLTFAEYTVDIDELWSTANRVLGVADVVDAVARRGSMDGAGTYGGFVDEPARTWASRYSYLLRGLAHEIERSGYDLKGTADAYFDVELTVRDRLKQLESWHSTTTGHAPWR